MGVGSTCPVAWANGAALTACLSGLSLKGGNPFPPPVADGSAVIEAIVADEMSIGVPFKGAWGIPSVLCWAKAEAVFMVEI